ncbi:aminobenzoyl-glutamate transporter [Synergistales bacterium]|nr:aminobenzoyl-glutamate transporter [Synergistales bacterium]
MSEINVDTSVKKRGFLAWIERVGNKMPHPFKMFMEIAGVVLLLSLVLGLMEVSAVHPATKETIKVVNLVSFNGLLLFMSNFIKNFQNFPVLGIVLILGISSGICDRTGFFSSAIKMGLAQTRGNMVVFIIAIIGTLGNHFGDAAFILIPPIAGAIFYSLDRHPLAGVFLGYATVGGSFTTSLTPQGMDVILTPIGIQGARLLQPDFDMSPLSGYYFLCLSAILCAISATFVTIKIIEPMLGKYNSDEGDKSQGMQVTPEEAIAVKKAVKAVVIFFVIVAVASFPSNSFLRNAQTGSLVVGSPLVGNLTFFIFLIFLLMGLVYGVSMGKIRGMNDLIKMMEESTRTLVPFIVLVIAIAQFLFFFNESKLGQVLAIRGGEFLASLSAPTQVIAVLFLLLTAFVNLFIGSGSSKWLLLAPIFVPMFMQLNIHPAFTQIVYRLGDSCTNHLTPLFAYFAILLTTTQQYDKNAGMGTLFSAMLPYSATFLLVYGLQTVIWITLNLPTGIGGSIWMN